MDFFRGTTPLNKCVFFFLHILVDIPTSQVTMDINGNCEDDDDLNLEKPISDGG